jgi:hypothetical protein
LSAQNSRHTTAVLRSSIIDERRYENAQHHGGKLPVSCCDRIVQLWRWWPGGYEKRGVNRTTPIAMKCLHTIVEMGRETYMHVVYNTRATVCPFFNSLRNKRKKNVRFCVSCLAGGRREWEESERSISSKYVPANLCYNTHITHRNSPVCFFPPFVEIHKWIVCLLCEEKHQSAPLHDSMALDVLRASLLPFFEIELWTLFFPPNWSNYADGFWCIASFLFWFK